MSRRGCIYNEKHQAPSTKHQAPSTKHQAPSTKHQAPSTKHQAPSTAKLLTVFVSLLSHPLSAASFLFLTFSSPNAFAALSATTNRTIMGEAPYFTIDGGKTKVQSADSILSITLSNGVQYDKANNPSTPEKPIELPAENQSLADVTMAIPKTLSAISLNDLVHAPYNSWGDDNGDGAGDDGVTATGNLTMSVTDIWGNNVNRATVLTLCDSPYKVTLNASGSLTTQYGDPRSINLGEGSVTYYFRPKMALPLSCWAQPNLDFSRTHKHPKPEAPWASFIGVDGPASQWNPDRGFILQSLSHPSANFPTMGANGLFFNLIVGGGLGKNVTYSQSPVTSGISLEITANGTNTAKVKLVGPRNGATPAQAQTAVPTTFTLYSDSSKSNAIYTFTIGKWFIAKSGDGGGWNADFCQQTYGGSYRTPHIVEYSNANSEGWTGGLAGQSTTYQRRIGGGLFAEWGNMENGGSNGRKSIYQESDFDNIWFWAAEVANPADKNDGLLYHWYIDSYGGWVNYTLADVTKNRLACITP